jgi:hypothetical protein
VTTPRHRGALQSRVARHSAPNILYRRRSIGHSVAAVNAPAGEPFDAIVTGASDQGTWVRLVQPPVEGRRASGFEGTGVGRRLRVQLVRTDVVRGHIDFKGVS